MKAPNWITVASVWAVLAGVLLGGCYIASVHPIAHPDQRIFDPALVGTWANGPDTLRISGDGVDNLEFYIVEGPGPTSDSTRAGNLDVLVTRIKDWNFLDVRPTDLLNSSIPILEQTLLLPMHAVMRYQISGDSLIIQYFSYREFDQKNRAGKAYGLELERVADAGPLLITSNTDKIRRFLDKYGGEEALFGEPTAYVRQR